MAGLAPCGGFMPPTNAGLGSGGAVRAVAGGPEPKAIFVVSVLNGGAAPFRGAERRGPFPSGIVADHTPKLCFLRSPNIARKPTPRSIIAQVEGSGVDTAVIVPSIAIWIGALPETPDTSAK
jgi:hypothetical protein